MESWIKRQGDKIGEPWKSMIANPEVIEIAHAQSCAAQSKAKPSEHVVTFEDFRPFLLHLYAFSVLWAHFENADNWVMGSDVGNKVLNYTEFALACRTLQGHDTDDAISELQIKADFRLMDVNGDGKLSFLEV